MEIVIWIVTVICVSLVLGECYYRFLRKKELMHKENINNISDSIDESTEYDLKDLGIESFVTTSREKLQRRGSWRLAQDQIMTALNFKQSSDNEYRKML